MRNDDEAFADIIRREFDEPWTGEPAPAAPVLPDKDHPPAQPGPLPDFHLNLYDDEESYRDVPDVASSISATTVWGLALVAAGLLITLLRVFPLGVPQWVGWIAVACFVAGVSLGLWHLTHTRRVEDDDEGSV